MVNKDQKKILIGCEQIMAHIGVSRPLFYDFLKKGMPARLINNRWYAHVDNLDNFFKKITLFREKNIPENAE